MNFVSTRGEAPVLGFSDALLAGLALPALRPGLAALMFSALAVGGSAYGHHTLTRFFAMHAGVLPVALIVVLAAHIALFRRHGITAKITPGRPDDYFWPRQVLFDAIGCFDPLLREFAKPF